MASELSQSETGVNRSSAGATVFYFSCVAALISFAVLLAAAVLRGAWSLTAVSAQRFVIPNAMEFAALAAIGVLGGCGRSLRPGSPLSGASQTLGTSRLRPERASEP